MRRIALLVLIAVFAAAGAFAQPRTFGARKLVLDNGASTYTYVTANTGLGISATTPYVPSACAILDLNANTTGVAKLGFLGPRVAEVDKINICGGTPPAGMLIYNSTFNYYEYFNGAIWAPVVAGWSLHGNGSTIPPAAATTPVLVNPGDFFLGTLDAVDFVVVTDSRQRIRVEGDAAATGNTVEILNDGATSTGLKIYANGGTGINIDPASTGVMIDATGTGIEFTNSQPITGIDMFNGASGTGMIIDNNTPLGIQIGAGAPSGQGISVNALVNGMTVGDITAPNDGLDINATSTGILVGALTQPNFGLDVDAGITGATVDAPTIGIDVGQTTPSILGVGVQSVGTGIDVREFAGGTGISVNNVFGGAFGAVISNNFGNIGVQVNADFMTSAGLQLNSSFSPNAQIINNSFGGTGLLVQQAFSGTGINLQGGGTSTLGMNIAGYTTSITTDAQSTFGNGVGADNHTFNNGTGDMTVNLAGGASDLILNGIDQTAIPGPFDNILWLNGNIVEQSPNGVNIVTGSGTLNTIPLWTPDGFKLGNSIVTQEANASGINVTPTGAGGANVVEINNFNATQTGVKINANGGIGVDVDPASTGIIIDATSTGMLIDGSTPTTGINVNRAGNFGVTVGSAVAPGTGVQVQATGAGVTIGNITPPVTGVNVDATNTGILIQPGPTFAGLSFDALNSGVAFGSIIQSSGTANMSFGHRISQGSSGSIDFGSHITTEVGSTGIMRVGYSIQHLGSAPFTSALLALNLSANPLADMQYGLRIRNGGAADITTGASIVDDAGGGIMPLGMEIIDAVQGMNIQSTGGTSINVNQNVISTGGYGRFDQGLATTSTATAPVSNQVTWFNTNNGTLSTQVLTAPRTWLLPDETGVLDAYDPLNNNGFVYFQPEVAQAASAAGSYGDNPLIFVQGLATTPNGVAVDMSTNPVGGVFPSAFTGSIIGQPGTNVNGAFVNVIGTSGQTVGTFGNASATTGSVWGAVGQAISTTGTARGTYGFAGGTNTSIGATGEALFAGLDNIGVLANVSNGTVSNVGLDATATGVGSIGVDVNAGSRTGMRITDVDVAGASTGIFIDKTTGGTQTAGIDINNASLVVGSTISDGILVRRANNGVITNGMRVVGATTDFVAADAATTNTGFSSLLQGQVGFNSQATSGTGFQATALTSGTGFSAAVNGGGDGVTASVSGGATGRGVVSTNTSTATGSKAGVFVGNNAAGAGSTNIAMQVERGEFTMGRDNSGGHVETGINEGPSGVVNGVWFFLPAPGDGDLSISGADLLVTNQHVSPSSIILLTPLTDGGFGGGSYSYSLQVTSRAAGSFTVRATENNFIASPSIGFVTVRFGYMVINPDR